MTRAALVIAFLAAVLTVPRLGHRQIVGSHEAVFPIVARDIVERGAWMGAELRGLPYRNKPPLYPWAIAALSWPAGRVTEITARVPVILAAIGSVVGTFLLGARLFGRRAGLWAALILLTSVVFFDQATGRPVPNPDFLAVVERNFPRTAKLVVGCQAGGRSQRA